MKHLTGWSSQAADDCDHCGTILRENRRGRDDDQQTNFCQICYSRWVGHYLDFVCLQCSVCVCFVLFRSLPFSLFLGWSSGICCVIRLKDDLGTIHSNQQTFLKPRFLKPKIIWEMNWSIPRPQNGTFNPPIWIWWWFNSWIEEVMGSISLISTQFQFWASWAGPDAECLCRSDFTVPDTQTHQMCN